MQQINNYLIDQTVIVEIYDISIPKIRNRIVYARNVKIYKRIDNQIRLAFLNQDQKATAIMDKTITFYMFHPEDSSILVTVNAVISTSDVGVAFITIPKDAIEFITPGLYNYAVYIVDGEGKDQVAYADDNYGAGGTIELIDGRYPLI